jgi:hypothetical protein
MPFLKMENRKANQVGAAGVGTSKREEDIRKEYRRVNMVEILRIHVCKQKNETC